MGHPDGGTTHYTLNKNILTQNCTDYTEDSGLAENIGQHASQRAKCKFTCDFSASAASEDINQHDLDEITQKGKSLRPCCQPDGNSQRSTANN